MTVHKLVFITLRPDTAFDFRTSVCMQTHYAVPVEGQMVFLP
jgi:hypothetical protein